ncbi:diacylglycerol-acyltransferase [Desarmillaria tabescens]|uniref:diacylglycerol O-acyltransferase n=1 Tax=Armillaria tabescens TaxID=1929756 RepID=A0AA39JZ71_ARMTA|nr:diacylglycerol-acyltransferase [Desarmillaria tabescens]KAK0450461.1 diacylglycerol-acyltransferase [Desarmillaria tabescens]
MLAIASWSFLILKCCTLFIFLYSFPPLWPPVTCYMIWVYCLDKSPEHGGRVWHWYRRCSWWRYFVAYYPITCLKEADLPPSRTYVFGYHPHGIIGTGAFANFATDTTGVSKLFPGITTHLLTLSSNFKLPFYRECMIHLGMGSMSKRSCINILQSGPGQSITIVVGGAAEILSAHPGTADLTLRKRLGFIKLAIQEGADLVPVFSGENDILSQLPNEKGSVIYMFQKKLLEMFGFTLSLLHGRGLLNYNLGLLPYRQRITAVV